VMGGRTRKLRNHARRTGVAQASRFDAGAKVQPVAAEVVDPADTTVQKKKTTKKTKKSKD